MDRPRALKVSRVLLMKTTANGCTVAEAADAAEKLAEYMQLYRISLPEIMGASPAVKSSAAPPRQTKTRPPPRPYAQPKRAAAPHRIDWCKVLVWLLVIRFVIYVFYE
jgi:hypothetical protein